MLLLDDVVRFNLTYQVKGIVEKAGAKFDGIQKIQGEDKYALATDLQTGSTYYISIDGLTKAIVQNKLFEEREKKFRSQKL